jgi:hypothetical protein
MRLAHQGGAADTQRQQQIARLKTAFQAQRGKKFVSHSETIISEKFAFMTAANFSRFSANDKTIHETIQRLTSHPNKRLPCHAVSSSSGACYRPMA